jgi:hypothetical protein
VEPDEEFARLRDRDNWTVRGLGERALPVPSRRRVAFRWVAGIAAAAVVTTVVIVGVAAARQTITQHVFVPDVAASPDAVPLQFDQFPGTPNGVEFIDHYSSDPGVIAWWGAERRTLWVSLWGNTCIPEAGALRAVGPTELSMTFTDRVEPCKDLGTFNTTVIPIPPAIEATAITTFTADYGTKSATVAIGDLPKSDACTVDELSPAVAIAEGRSGSYPSVRFEVTNRSDAACRLTSARAAYRLDERGERLNPNAALGQLGDGPLASVLVEPGDTAIITIGFVENGSREEPCHPVSSAAIEIQLAREPGSVVGAFASDYCDDVAMAAYGFWQRGEDPR